MIFYFFSKNNEVRINKNINIVIYRISYTCIYSVFKKYDENLMVFIGKSIA
ncbi:hypothetical protein GOD95_06050 [Paeniclostridium sordellii]|uniref:hypothetical protein n=1 Tax=Paraclostridium sordellii TaxID=1505 RepID=UPI0012D7C9B7|nr:hypothetical protein [Paeniclostridium sordellii]MVO71008.1 hypothetical protein [Paeniclostridium sordellii]